MRNGRIGARRGFAAAVGAAWAVAAGAQGPQAPTADQLRALERRITILESQMRAVQRQVFPGGDRRFFAPEEPAPAPGPSVAPTPATDPLADLATRIDALEAQQRTLTGQIEQLQFGLRELRTSFEKSRGDTEARLGALETSRSPAPAASPPAAAAPAPAAPPARSGAAGVPAPPRPAADPEAAYQAAYAHYRARDWARAAAELEAFAQAHPKSPRASNARYWAGRAEMERGRPAEAAKLFLANYRTSPEGAMAASSLLWLGKALIALKQPKAACDALDQLRTAYPERLQGTLAAEAQKARAEAKCRP
ncbi:MAG: tetratricopeptide repeat protein [Sphingomonadaceae bacterium]|uniref:tetratricopeptide repeat protein n=1 Tax=Thermaurantiacus sp. TaxID=2820283 RepID=UPI00298F31DB|nr:tetratricopeptide repeat protein [Thermaurantiacus sp.]MCS6987452.1 tetratricopeptide repeat protein [Sphingomonadaceae bacterium]MDW8415372.1 tetratricopeptide repeat protein [Thermaurantiacus sp.]